MIKLNEIKSTRDLADCLDMPVRKLTYILYVKKVENYYRSFGVPKKNGGIRHINASQGDLKIVQSKLAEVLWKFVDSNGIKMNASHAFEKKKGIISNSKSHRNKRFILNLDLENFFDNIHFGRIKGFFQKNRNFNFPIDIATKIAQLTCYQGALPQGAPSSPIISNLICAILDVRLARVARMCKFDYSRYADDITFSTNDKKFMHNQYDFLDRIKKEINQFGFSVNENKTRIVFCDSRQTVTGLVVNKKISVNREYYKNTRAMADALYRNGEFKINGLEGTVKQLEGRLSFINQLDYYNNKIDNNSHSFRNLSSREKQYQKFLFYKYFFANIKPIIVTEGKTDILYLKAALKSYCDLYPNLITKKGEKFDFHISFLRKTKRLKYFLDIQQDGADTMKNIYNCYVGKNCFPNIAKQLNLKGKLETRNPVILIFDNEQKTGRPLKKFIDYIKLDSGLSEVRYKNIINNLYLLTNPLPQGKEESEIEDLFSDEVLSHEINGKSFSRGKTFSGKSNYGKEIFSQYVARNYNSINFTGFKEMLNDISKIVAKHMEMKGILNKS